MVLNQSIFYSNAFYDLFASQIFFHIAITRLASWTISVNKLISTVSMTIFFAVFLISLSARLRGVKVLSTSLLDGDVPTAKTPIKVTQTIY